MAISRTGAACRVSEALRLIIEDTDFAHRLGLEGRKTAVNDFQLSTVVEKCIKLYRRLLKKDLEELGQLYEAPLVLGGERK